MIEVGEKEDTQILSATKKKIFGTKIRVAPKNAKAVAPKNTVVSRYLQQ